MAEPLQPHDIARRTFGVVRKGYEQQEVRGFLHEVSALLERLQRSEQELKERVERTETKLGASQEPDEAMLLEVLGAETTRVLTSAREAAGEIRGKAEEAAARIIAEATAEAAEIRSAAVKDSDDLMAEAKQETAATLEQARTELDRRSAEAEEAAGRIRAAGEEAAQTLRDAGQADLARARTEAEAALEAARQEGRVMVAEAQAVRARVLRDLAVRRKKARQQVEKLNAGRERLLEAYEVVKRTVTEATDELTTSLSDARLAADAAARRIDEEPEPTLEQLDEEVANAGLVDLPIAEIDLHEDYGPGPFSGEVPAVADPEPDPDPEPEAVAELSPAPGAQLEERRGRKRRKKGFSGLPAGELSVVQPSGEEEGVRILAEPAAAAESPIAAGPELGDTASDQAGASVDPGEATAHTDAPDAPGEAETESDVSSDAGGTTDGTETVAEARDGAAEVETNETREATTPTTVDPAEVVATDAPASDEGVAAAEEAPASPADTVFARLRAGTDDEAEAEPPAESPAGEVGGQPDADTADVPSPVVDATRRPFAARAAALASVEKDLGRRLKRVMADEQNEVLDLLRRAKPSGVDDLLPGADDHAARWADVVAVTLREAAGAGADWSGGTPSSVADLCDELARGLTMPLRERIDRSFSASDGNLDDVADRVRALYREWKGQRLRESASHFSAAAYARGVLDGVAPGAMVRWVVDPDAGPCPDCDDNVLAGDLPKGSDFPTGSSGAPAHPGCHCLVLAADT